MPIYRLAILQPFAEHTHSWFQKINFKRSKTDTVFTRIKHKHDITWTYIDKQTTSQHATLLDGSHKEMNEINRIKLMIGEVTTNGKTWFLV